jgi:DnaJ-domain-containing protein 1
MTDYFALLEQPRRPWLDAEVLRAKFLELSANLHPDRVHRLGETERAAAQARYVELNGAYNCLREPKDRLRHLLELESGAAPTDIQHAPSELMDFLTSIGEVCREADKLIAERSGITSRLLKVQFFERSQGWIAKLENLRQEITTRRERLMEELRRIDEAWASDRTAGSARAGALRRLEKLHCLFSYFDRWLGRIQERIVQLTL